MQSVAEGAIKDQAADPRALGLNLMFGGAAMIGMALAARNT